MRRRVDGQLWFLIVAVTLGFLGVLAALFFVDLPKDRAGDMFALVVTTLVLAFREILHYKVGSSQGSKDKDEDARPTPSPP